MLRLLLISLSLASAGLAQVVGPVDNVLLPANANLAPVDQPIQVGPGGRFLAVVGSNPAGDVEVVEVDPDGVVEEFQTIEFPDGNGVSTVNRALVTSRTGRFMVCYGSQGHLGDLVFMTRDTAGDWQAENILFPAGVNVPLVGTRPVISRDEDFIVCRGGLPGYDLIILPIDHSGPYPVVDTGFQVPFPFGTSIPLDAVDPVLAPDDRSLAIPVLSNFADVAVVTLDRPLDFNNTVVTEVDFPGLNTVADFTVPLQVAPDSSWYAAHGTASDGDLVLIPIDAADLPLPAENVAWPNNAFTVSTQVPPAVSGDGRLIAVNGSRSDGDLLLLPIEADGTPGVPLDVGFPQNNYFTAGGRAPVVSPDGRLVLQTGGNPIGDVVVTQVEFTAPDTLTATAINVLYPQNNYLPSLDAGIALAPDRSYFATLGGPNLGDLVITPLAPDGTPGIPENVLYPANNNPGDPGATPEISRSGLHIVTSGTSSIGDAVVTHLELDPATDEVIVESVTNLLYPQGNSNAPLGRAPRFSESERFVYSAGQANTGDLVIAPIETVVPRLLLPLEPGKTSPIRFQSPQDAGRFYVAAAALSRTPGLTLSDGRVFPLEPDPLFFLSLATFNPYFSGFRGVLDTYGDANGSVTIADVPALRGRSFYIAFAVADPSDPTGIGTISDPALCLIE